MTEVEATKAAPVLPATVGRIVAPDEPVPSRVWAIDQLIAENEVNGIALADAGKRSAIGVAVLQAFTGDSRTAWLFGQRVQRRCTNALVLTTTDSALRMYRSAYSGDARVTTVRMCQRFGTDQTYWSSLRAYVRDLAPSVVLVDTAQDLEGLIYAPVCSELAAFGCTVVAMLRGNETKAGAVGGASVWDAATVRFWLDQKDNLTPVIGSQIAAALRIDLATPHRAPYGEPNY